jgi:radical SAM protein with 4Fe4S-binding SPASM domain
MIAKNKPYFDDNEKRQYLKDIVPLDMPFTVMLAPTHRCNFRCKYCTYSLVSEKIVSHNMIDMDFGTFEKFIDSSKKFPRKYKFINFNGLGEPLLHPKIVDMIKLSHKVCDGRIEMFTNASLLTNKMADGIIDAGLSRLKISIQGTSEQKYKELCGVKINFEELRSYIAYFYQRSRGKNTIVHIKTMKEQLADDNDEQKFFSLFGDMCDEISVQNMGEIQPYMQGKNKDVNSEHLFGERYAGRNVCPMAFYMMEINAEGNCYPCCVFNVPVDLCLGNVAGMPLTEMWNGKKHKEILLSLLKKDDNRQDVCIKCKTYNFGARPNDDLDAEAQEIIKRVEML